MCHHRDHDSEWTTAKESLDTDEETESEETDPDLPSFLSETATEEDVEILTDGGDEA
ncbi:hypothetical protein [Haloarcula halophila]|uniref:hypothetical protein n=1 Tax=Haloarcula TaxID=2237 RepID=UPI0023E401F0|nr:hypothetical protein [Halomicroarcula sp. DFY41]